MLMESKEQFKVHGSERTVWGSTLARLIMVHAAATTDFGARSSYVTQSTLPAVFGDDSVRFMDAYAKNAEDAALYMRAPVRIGKTGLKATMYDVANNLTHLADAARKGIEDGRESLASRFAVKQRPEIAPPELRSSRTGAKFVAHKRITKIDPSSIHLFTRRRPSTASRTRRAMQSTRSRSSGSTAGRTRTSAGHTRSRPQSTTGRCRRAPSSRTPPPRATVSGRSRTTAASLS
jgi:hypothetical protein